MSTYMYPNGLGQTLGDPIVTGGQLYMSGIVYYVHYGTGNDANAGTDPDAPKKTIGGAFAELANNDVIVLLDGHDETLTTTLTLANTGVSIVGAGSSGGKPTAKLTMNAANSSMISVATASFTLGNVWIKTNAQANASPTIKVSSSGFKMRGCYLECTVKDVPHLQLNTGASAATIEDTTFISTGTSVATAPGYGMVVNNPISDLTLNGVVFDGGTYAFSIAGYCEAGVAVTRLVAEQVSLLRGADAQLDSGTVGHFMPTTATGNAKVLW